MDHTANCFRASTLVLLALAAGCDKGGTSSPAGRPSASRPSVQVLVGADGRADFAAVKPGTTVKAFGECTGLKSDGNVGVHVARRFYGPRPGIMAPDLLKAFAADKAAAEKKYKGQGLVVTGVLTGTEPFSITLSGTQEPGPADTSAPPGAVDLAAAKPELTITADQFAAQAKAAKGKVVELTGVVEGFMARRGDKAAVRLKAAKNVLGIVCFTADEQPWATLSPGQEVKLRGKGHDGGITAALVDCVVLEKGNNPAPTVAAEALAGDYAADPKATDARYSKPGDLFGKYVYITGEVEAREGKAPDAVTFRLNCKGDVGIELVVPPIDAERADIEVQPGTQVKALAQYEPSRNPKVVKLREPFFIYGK